MSRFIAKLLTLRRVLKAKVTRQHTSKVCLLLKYHLLHLEEQSDILQVILHVSTRGGDEAAQRVAPATQRLPSPEDKRGKGRVAAPGWSREKEEFKARMTNSKAPNSSP